MKQQQDQRINIINLRVIEVPIPRWVFMLAYLAVPVKFLFSLQPP